METTFAQEDWVVCHRLPPVQPAAAFIGGSIGRDQNPFTTMQILNFLLLLLQVPTSLNSFFKEWIYLGSFSVLEADRRLIFALAMAGMDRLSTFTDKTTNNTMHL